MSRFDPYLDAADDLLLDADLPTDGDAAGLLADDLRAIAEEDGLSATAAARVLLRRIGDGNLGKYLCTLLQQKGVRHA